MPSGTVHAATVWRVKSLKILATGESDETLTCGCVHTDTDIYRLIRRRPMCAAHKSKIKHRVQK